MNFKKNIKKIIHNTYRKIFNKRILHLELTSRCNLNCKACYRSGDFKNFMNINEILEINRLEILLNKYKTREIEQIILSGGENLLHPNFFDCLKMIRNYFPKKNITLSTNGTLLSNNKNLLEKICKSELNMIQFSINGAHQDTIDKLQKGINLKKTIEIIKYFQAKSSISLNVNFVIQEENINEINDFIELMGANKILNISLTPMNFAGHTDKEVNYTEIWKELNLKEKFLEAKELAKKYCIKIPEFIPICTSVFNVDVLTADGNMLPCWGKYLAKKYSMGNVFLESPQKIRKNKNFRDLQKEIKSGNIPKMCDSCWANGKHML